MDNNYLRKFLKSKIEEVTKMQTSFRSALTEYPHVVFDYNELTDEDGIKLLALTADFWDKGTPTQIIEAVDKFDSFFKYYKVNDAKMVLSSYLDTRQFIEDTDKTIQRIERKLYLRVIWKEK